MYIRDKLGSIMRISPDAIDEGDIPVTLIPTADWQRLVALLRLPIFRLLLKKMQPELAEIDEIIARTEAAND